MISIDNRQSYPAMLNKQVSYTIFIIVIMDKLEPYKYQLERLFVYYSSFGDKDNVTLLKIQNYRRLLTDMQLIVPPPSTNEEASLASKCDVLFYSKSSPTSALTFQAFLDLLQPLACYFFPQKAFQELLKFNIQPLHDHIMNETDFGLSISLISTSSLKESSYIFLHKFQHTLLIIYLHYFSKGGKQGESEQLKMFLKLSRQFGFIPKVASKPTAYLIFTFLRNRDAVIAFKTSLVVKTKYRFDFSCFIDYIIFLSQLMRRGQETDRVKIYCLLQSMQISQGYKDISKMVKLEHFFVSNHDLQDQIKEKKQIVQQENIQKKSYKIVQDPQRKKLGQYYESLKTKFVRLCTKKNVQSNFYLKQSVATKMLTQICPKLPQSTCQHLVSSVGRLSFQNFITILNLAAERLKIDHQKIYQQVSNYTEGSSNLPLLFQNMHLQEQQQKNCQSVLKLSHSYLKTLFDFYQFSGSISLSNYLKLLQDTEIIPTVMNSIKASDIYTACQKGLGLNFQAFELSFLRIIVSVHFGYQLEGVERLLYIFEIICKSKRGETLMKKNLLMIKEHPLYKVRLIFGDIYKKMAPKLPS